MSVSVVQCRATSRTGKQCKNKANPWWSSVPLLWWRQPHVAAKAAIRAEVMS
jgi:hypothetical protein